MLNRVCYFGDDDFTGAAIYLAGIMAHYELDYDHVDSSQSPPGAFDSLQYGLYVLSDYPAVQFRKTQLAHIADCVRRGSGLAMFGGWESFHGRLGEYHASPLVEVLPVKMAAEDDRRNAVQPCLIHKVAEHPILDGLPWDRPPGIGGFNALAPKLGTATVLESMRFSITRHGDDYHFAPGERSPLLVLGQYGEGRVAALATDVAPHWVGGLVDWGDRRIVQDVEGGLVDIGNWYARFFRNLLVWTGQLNTSSPPWA